MTTEQLKQNYAAVVAHENGKKVEVKSTERPDKWDPSSKPLWDFEHFEYRPAPEPVSRPWEQKDVPLNCWIRSKRNPDLLMFVNTIWHVGVAYSDAGRQPRSATFAQLFENWEWSTDRKEWKACAIDAVTEPAQ